MVQVLTKIYQKYFITNSKVKPLIYVQIQKVLYGLLRSALLFYRNFVKDHEAYGLQINPYDPCLANKMINDKHMTVLWNSYDLKVSHVSRFKATKFARYLSIIYGGLTVYRGKVHKYLVIDLDYSKKGTVKESVIK